MKKTSKFIYLIIFLSMTHANAGEFNAALGNFDFSDKNKKSSMLDLTYGFTERNIDSSIGQIKPLMGAFITGDNAAMAYAGAKIDYRLGTLMITPSFTPGLYSKGDGKDLGNILEFKSQVNIGLDLGLSTILSIGYSHISNASLGDKNPGANSYSFNFAKQF